MFRQMLSGQAKVPVNGAYHCGIDDSDLHFRYGVELCFHDSALDDKGFLLDNTTMRNYWQTLSNDTVEVSCELLAKQVCQYCTSLLSDRLQHLLSVRVYIEPFKGAMVEHYAIPPFSTDSYRSADMQEMKIYPKGHSELDYV